MVICLLVRGAKLYFRQRATRGRRPAVRNVAAAAAAFSTTGSHHHKRAFVRRAAGSCGATAAGTIDDGCEREVARNIQ